MCTYVVKRVLIIGGYYGRQRFLFAYVRFEAMTSVDITMKVIRGNRATIVMDIRWWCATTNKEMIVGNV